MKTNELHLGNYVNVPNPNQSPFRIDGFEYLNSIDCKVEMNIVPNSHPLTWWLKDLSPITLTKDWLLKFGFKQYNFDEDGIQDYCYIKSNFPIYQIDDTGFYYLDQLEIKYVHDLQNLYSIIRKEQLTLKL